MRRLVLGVIIGLYALSMGVFSEELSSMGTIKDVRGPGSYAITGLERGGSVSFGGYFDTEYSYGKNSDEETESVFDNHHLIMELAAQLHPRLLFNSEIEYEHAGRELKIEQAWLDFKFSDAFTQRAGAVVVPFGRINILHDSDVRELTDRGLYARHIVPTTWTEIGFGAHGFFEINDIEINYEGYVVQGLTGVITESNGLRGARNPKDDDNNVNKAIVGRVGVSPYLGLDVGTSIYTGKYTDSGNQRLTMFGLDAAWKEGPFEVISEYALVKLGVDAASATIIPEEMYGYYIEGRYHMAPAFLKSLLPDFRKPTLTLFTRLGAIDTDVNNTASAETHSEKTRLALGFNVRPIEHVVYKIEYHINEEQGEKVDNNQVLASVAVGF